MPKSLHRDLNLRRKRSSSRLIVLLAMTSDSEQSVIVKGEQNEDGGWWFTWALFYLTMGKMIEHMRHLPCFVYKFHHVTTGAKADQTPVPDNSTNPSDNLVNTTILEA